jgi:hypothetical protein
MNSESTHFDSFFCVKFISLHQDNLERVVIVPNMLQNKESRGILMKEINIL